MKNYTSIFIIILFTGLFANAQSKTTKKADKLFSKFEFVKAAGLGCFEQADVVGLMCLKVFVNGNQEKYDGLKDFAMALGSAFQKVNFLRDLKADYDGLNRTYFPNTDLENLDETAKQQIINDIESDFSEGLKGIKMLPLEAKFGVFMAYRYYSQLLKKLKTVI